MLHSLLRHCRCQRLQTCAATNSCCTSAAAFAAAPPPLPAAPDLCCSQQLLHERCCIRCCATAATSGSRHVLQPKLLLHERCCIRCCAIAATSGSRHVLPPTAAARALLHSLLRHCRYQRLQTCAAANSCSTSAVLHSLLRHRRYQRLQACAAAHSCCCTSAAAFAAALSPLPAAPDLRCSQQLLHERCCIRCCAIVIPYNITTSPPYRIPPTSGSRECRVQSTHSKRAAAGRPRYCWCRTTPLQRGAIWSPRSLFACHCI